MTPLGIIVTGICVKSTSHSHHNKSNMIISLIKPYFLPVLGPENRVAAHRLFTLF